MISSKIYTRTWIWVHVVGLIIALFFSIKSCYAFPPIFDPHPMSLEEIIKISDDEIYKYDRDILDEIDPDRAPHSTEDAKNFANRG
jgi:hypothetical protein